MNAFKTLILGAALCAAPLAAFSQDNAGGSAGDGDRPTTYTRLTFPELDKNKDGYISKSEQQASKLDAGLFKKMDTNSDGKVSETEFDSYQAMTSGNAVPPKNLGK
jgi:hypothetical protein